jgi:chemotaxis protein MotA
VKSDGATILGYVMGSLFIMMGISDNFTALEKLAGFIDIPSIQIVIGGTIATVFVSFTFAEAKGMFGVCKQGFLVQEVDPISVIEILVQFAEKARREGLLSLEEDMDQISNPFIKKGIQLVVDGTDPELVRSILEAEVNQLEARHMAGLKMIGNVSTFGPAFGMIGTLVGLVNMLAKLDDPSSLGPSMAVALVTTFYGAVLSNLFSIPLEKNLEAKNTKELLLYEVAVEGLLSIQAGDNPRIVEERLKAFLPPSLRGAIGKKEEE